MNYTGNIQFLSHPVGFPDTSTAWIDGHFNGTTVTYRGGPNDNLVLSVQPDGSYQTRTVGTQGPWEVTSLISNLNCLTYNPLPGVVYQVVFRATP